MDGNVFTLYAEKEITNVIYACRVGPNDFNQTNNFSIISGSGRKMYGTNDTGVMNGFPTNNLTSSAFTSSNQPSSPIHSEDPVETMTLEEDGETVFIHPGLNKPTMYGNDNTTFITQVHLWNEHGEMVAIASLSKPLKKSYNREVYIKVKLTY